MITKYHITVNRTNFAERFLGSIRNIIYTLTLLTIAVSIIGCAKNNQPSERNIPNQELIDGMTQLLEENYEKALPLLETAVQKAPRSASAHCNLGIALLKLNNTTRAIKAFETAAMLNANDARPLEFLATALSEAGNKEEARNILEEAHEHTSHSPRILTSLAVAEIQCGKTNLTYLTEAIKLKPSYAPALYNMALILRNRVAQLEADNNDSTADKLECIKFCKAYLYALDNQTNIPDKQDNNRTALITKLHNDMLNNDSTHTKTPTHAIVKTPNPIPIKKTDPILTKARMAIKDGSYTTALVLLKQAIKKTPKNPDLLWELAIVYDKHLKYKDSAIRTYNQFSNHFPNDQRISDIPKYKKATVQPTHKPIAKKEITTPTETATNIAKSKASALLANALHAYNNGKTTESANLYKRVLEIDKTNTIAAYNLGLIYYNSGKDLNKARDAFLLVLQNDPNMATSRYMLGVVYKRLGDNDNAIKQLNKTLQIRPTYAKAQFVLGLIYYSKQQFDVARLHLKRYLQFDPTSPYSPRAKQLLGNIEKELSGDARKPPMPR